ncbi:HAD-IIA family hydrolase [Actinoplanes bogorensis]|uniref:HAD-IIA family hydrolase n=1 Tax=Paractinoplanes bogorensis TaxID=1610840 RepID=A0ABS5Z353_9ACTN|nr:HAD-IIA family hydrolase [Actinoplanes bogorensis]
MAGGYDQVIFDLDGVVYLIDKPIPGAVEAVETLRGRGTAVAYATNNASRRAAEVAALLTGMGVPAEPAEVLNSAGAAAALLAGKLPAGSPVLVVGADALRDEVTEAGLTPVQTLEDEPVAVVQGYGPDVGWRILAEAVLAVRGGALWVATNTDRTLPSPRGPLPGNGSLVAVLRTALDREPDVVVGKPEPALFTTAAAQAGARRPLVVGDRLDTDIQGAVTAGLDSLLVLTGVSSPADLLAAELHRRPAFVAADLSGLFRPANEASVPLDAPEADGWRVTRDGHKATLDGAGDPVVALRLLCAATWDGVPLTGLEPASDAARELLNSWGL